MEQILEQWREHLMATRRSLHTIRNYLSDCRQFAGCAREHGIDPLKLDRAAALIYLAILAKKYTSRATIMRQRDAVKQLYKFMVEINLIAKNPFNLFDRMRVHLERKPPRFLTQDEARRLIDSIGPNPELLKPVFPKHPNGKPLEAQFLAIRDRALIETIYGTGTRAQETANLNWRDVDFKAGFIRVNEGKGGFDRIVPIPDSALIALWEYGKAYRDRFEMEPAGKNPLFLSHVKTRITTRSIGRAVSLRLKVAGIETTMSTHGLRHTFATHLMQEGADIITIAKMLGHRNLSSTQKYTHVALTDVQSNYHRGHPRA